MPQLTFAMKSRNSELVYLALGRQFCHALHFREKMGFALLKWYLLVYLFTYVCTINSPVNVKWPYFFYIKKLFSYVLSITLSIWTNKKWQYFFLIVPLMWNHLYIVNSSTVWQLSSNSKMLNWIWRKTKLELFVFS